MKIVVLDGYTENPGDLSWEPLRASRTGRRQSTALGTRR